MSKRFSKRVWWITWLKHSFLFVYIITKNVFLTVKALLLKANSTFMISMSSALPKPIILPPDNSPWTISNPHPPLHYLLPYISFVLRMVESDSWSYPHYSFRWYICTQSHNQPAASDIIFIYCRRYLQAALEGVVAMQPFKATVWLYSTNQHIVNYIPFVNAI